MSDQIRGARSRKEFCEWAGIGLTLFHEEVKAGRLKVRKIGKKTLVLDEDGRAWLAGLPAEEPRSGKTRTGVSAHSAVA